MAPLSISLEAVNATALAVTIGYERNQSVARCTQYEMQVSNETLLVPCGVSETMIGNLEADSLYTVQVTAVSDYDDAGREESDELQAKSAWTGQYTAAPSILRPLMGPRKCGLLLQVVLK